MANATTGDHVYLVYNYEGYALGVFSSLKKASEYRGRKSEEHAKELGVGRDVVVDADLFTIGVEIVDRELREDEEGVEGADVKGGDDE